MQIALVLRPTSFTSFCFNAPYHYTPIINLRSLIFVLTPFGKQLSFTLIPKHSIISCRNIILELPSFELRPVFQKQNLGRTKEIDVFSVCSCCTLEVSTVWRPLATCLPLCTTRYATGSVYFFTVMKTAMFYKNVDQFCHVCHQGRFILNRWMTENRVGVVILDTD